MRQNAILKGLAFVVGAVCVRHAMPPQPNHDRATEAIQAPFCARLAPDIAAGARVWIGLVHLLRVQILAIVLSLTVIEVNVQRKSTMKTKALLRKEQVGLRRTHV